MTDDRIPLTILSPVASTRAPENYRSLERIAGCGRYDFDLVEVVGLSEVARARNRCVSQAYNIVKSKGGLVFWWDADMVLMHLETFHLHALLATRLQLAISGRYIVRQEVGRIAASIDEFEERVPFTETVEGMAVRLDPVLSGMGCLMVPSAIFLESADSSPIAMLKEGGKEIKEYLACCPRIVQNETNKNYAMLSEDYDYCKNHLKKDGKPCGVWLAYVTIGTDAPTVSYLDYGHLTRQILLHDTTKPSEFRDDR